MAFSVFISVPDMDDTPVAGIALPAEDVSDDTRFDNDCCVSLLESPGSISYFAFYG